MTEKSRFHILITHFSEKHSKKRKTLDMFFYQLDSASRKGFLRECEFVGVL